MDPIAQITGTNQFEGYTTGEFQKYMNMAILYLKKLTAFSIFSAPKI